MLHFHLELFISLTYLPNALFFSFCCRANPRQSNTDYCEHFSRFDHFDKNIALRKSKWRNIIYHHCMLSQVSCPRFAGMRNAVWRRENFYISQQKQTFWTQQLDLLSGHVSLILIYLVSELPYLCSECSSHKKQWNAKLMTKIISEADRGCFSLCVSINFQVGSFLAGLIMSQ